MYTANLCCDGGARLVEIDELAVQAELVEVAAGRLDRSGVGDPAAFNGSKPAALMSRSTVVAAASSSVA
jgi:hypothetical protein